MKKTPPALVLFIRDSLSRDEQFIYIADDQTVDELEGHLERLVGNGVRGDLSSEGKTRQILDFINEASQSGFKGSRLSLR